MLITRPPNGDYTTDMQMAKATGIDAFALNFGGFETNFTLQEIYLAEFYAAAKANDLPLFMSFDTTSVMDPTMIVRLVNQYKDHPAQLKVDGKIMLSTFTANPVAWNWQTDVLNKIPETLFLLGSLSDNAAAVFALPYDGAFTWLHPTKTVAQEADTDNNFNKQKASAGKYWMVGIASWFFKHFIVTEDWDQAQDDGIWVDRWFHILQLQPDFIEIITWNDWGESHYIGPADVDNLCSTCIWSKLDHSAFLKMAAIFIKAYKGSKSIVTVDPADEDVFMFYRTHPALTLGTSDTLPLPLDANYLKDEVFIVSALTHEATISFTTGNGNCTTLIAPAGMSKIGIPWAVGAQSMNATRGGKTIASKTGPNVVSKLPFYNGNVIAI